MTRCYGTAGLSFRTVFARNLCPGISLLHYLFIYWRAKCFIVAHWGRIVITLVFLNAAAPIDILDFANYIGTTFSDFTSWQYNLTFAIMIIIFTFFYTAITINPNQIADDMKRNGGFVPGVKPGKQTADFLDNILSKITMPGAIFLAIIAILPAFAMIAGVNQGFAQFYGGTSLLIMVGVILDTLQQIESYLLMRHYEGMMKSGRVKGRTQAA